MLDAHYNRHARTQYGAPDSPQSAAAELREALDRLLDEATGTPPNPAPELAHLSSEELDQRLTITYERVALGALELAAYMGVTGPAVAEVSEFIARLRERAETP